jgi:hypothetical protein
LSQAKSAAGQNVQLPLCQHVPGLSFVKDTALC